MFCGVRGTGKTSCAKIFAKAVNCLKNSNGNSCLECENCQKIENGNRIFILATTEFNKIPKTIVSRCQISVAVKMYVIIF